MKIVLTLFTLCYFTFSGYSQCTFDTLPPVSICMNTTIQLSNAGVATLSPNQIDNNSSDNCGINYLLVNGQASETFNCSNIGIHSVTLAVIDSSGNSSTCVAAVTVTDPSSSCALSTATLSQKESMFRIYPNPVAQTLNITSRKEPLQQLQLTTLTGQLILEKDLNNSKNSLELDVSNLPNSVYLLSITTENSRFTEKIIVQK